MIPLYILGMLLRFGPQHGYQIKKLIEEQLEDFTQIKLPNIYYHLEKMEADGFLMAHRDIQGVRPEKTTYRVSSAGEKKFNELLMQTLDIKYRPTFEIDAAFYFSDCLPTQDLLNSLNRYVNNMTNAFANIEEHRKEVMISIPENFRIYADIIFEHHSLHYQAEIAWAKQSINSIKEGNCL